MADNITRELLDSGTLNHYTRELSVTGLTSNPTIFDHAIKNSARLRRRHWREMGQGKSGEALFFELALEDITGAANSFGLSTTAPREWTAGPRSRCRPCSPTIRTAPSQPRGTSHRVPDRPNLFIKIPGTREGLPAIEEAIFAGIPVNVTLLFSREQYVAAAEAFCAASSGASPPGLIPAWLGGFLVHQPLGHGRDGQVPDSLHDQLGIAIAKRTYKATAQLLDSPRWQRALNAGARPQRLLWASTGTKDPKASDLLYIKALAAPFTVNTMPEATLKALADHGELGTFLPADGGDCEEVLAQFTPSGIAFDALAARLQVEGAKSFVEVLGRPDGGDCKQECGAPNQHGRLSTRLRKFANLFPGDRSLTVAALKRAKTEPRPLGSGC